MMLREAFYLIKHGIDYSDCGFGPGSSSTRCRVFVTTVGSSTASRPLLVIRMTPSGSQIVDHDRFDAILDVATCTTSDR